MIFKESVKNLLLMNLSIPCYQRPYKWTYKNVVDLLSDLNDAVSNSKKYENYKYRVGTVILHKISENGEVKYDVVDGQQRILSLILIMLCLDENYSCPLLNNSKFQNKITQKNLYNNYLSARDFLMNNSFVAENLSDVLENNIEVIVICVDNEAEAFQLFDSQNTRGKALDPHDLLKAYHLREMRDYPYEMRHAVTKWEAVKSEKIKELFRDYLFPIKNWSGGKKTFPFTAKDIDVYKGIGEDSAYTYARRANKAMPYYQITAPFLAGGSFFEMVAHYLEMLSDVKEEIATNSKFTELNAIIENKNYKSTGFDYAINLFYCALLCYYDKFRNFDERAVKKLFLWAFMLRIDRESLGYSSVNRYAIGEDGYTNKIPMFTLVRDARLHTEISNLPIEIKKAEIQQRSASRAELYEELKKLSGVGGGNNE